MATTDTPAAALKTKESPMQAIVAHEYGEADVLRLEEVERPTPKDSEVLVRVRAASLNAGDWHVMRGDPYLIRLGYGLVSMLIGLLLVLLKALVK